MSHLAKSRLVEEIIVELRRRGLKIPANIMSDLKSARTLMKIEKEDPLAKLEAEPKIDKYLANVEAFVISEAEKTVAPEKVEKWLTELDLASCNSCVKVLERKEEMRMIPGVPRDQKGIRVQPIENLPIERLEQMAAENKLVFRRVKDGHLVVYGSDEAVKDFIKKISRPNGPKSPG